MKNRRKFRQILINPHFQFSFIIHVLLLLAFCMSFFYLADLYFFMEMTGLGERIDLPKDHIYFELITKQKGLMNKVFILTGLFVSISVFIFGLIMSHRVAGPLYKLNKFLRENADKKDVEELRFRKGDYFQEIPESFNYFMKKRGGSPK